MIRAFRLVRTTFLDQAFTGKGAQLEGGRWNFKGHAVVYCSEYLSLAALEIIVNMEDYSDLEDLYSVISVDFPAECVETLDAAKLPAGWDLMVPEDPPKITGTNWLVGERTAVLRVPSAVIKSEWNYLLNPAHPDFKKIKVGKPEPFALDKRLKKK